MESAVPVPSHFLQQHPASTVGARTARPRGKMGLMGTHALSGASRQLSQRESQESWWRSYPFALASPFGRGGFAKQRRRGRAIFPTFSPSQLRCAQQLVPHSVADATSLPGRGESFKGRAKNRGGEVHLFAKGTISEGAVCAADWGSWCELHSFSLAFARQLPHGGSLFSIR